MRRLSSLPVLGDIHVRFLPTDAKFISDRSEYGYAYFLALEKGTASLYQGRQIVGQTTKIKPHRQTTRKIFPPTKNKFDYQIITHKRLVFTWALYELGDNGEETRIESADFNITDRFE